MSTRRRKARELSLQVLFQSDFTGTAPEAVIGPFFRDYPHDAEITEYTKHLACGVWQHKKEINAKIEAASEHWKVSRMSEVDCNILRMATFEILYVDDVPADVSINEAIEIAKKFGSEQSPAFVNGILDKIAKT